MDRFIEGQSEQTSTIHFSAQLFCSKLWRSFSYIEFAHRVFNSIYSSNTLFLFSTNRRINYINKLYILQSNKNNKFIHMKCYYFHIISTCNQRVIYIFYLSVYLISVSKILRIYHQKIQTHV